MVVSYKCHSLLWMLQNVCKEVASPNRLTQLEEIYRVLGELHKRLKQGHARSFKFPMHHVGDQQVDRWVFGEVSWSKRIVLKISQPDRSEAFWPKPDLINALTEEQFYELLSRTRDWVFTEYQSLGLH